MSINEVKTVSKWALACLDCDFKCEVESAESAESLARHHINEDIGDEDPRPNYGHTVTITPQTWVGRNV